MVCVCIKGKRIKKKYRRKILGRTMVEKVILVSTGEEIKRPFGWRKKQRETNEGKVDKRMKKNKN